MINTNAVLNENIEILDFNENTIFFVSKDFVLKLKTRQLYDRIYNIQQ